MKIFIIGSTAYAIKMQEHAEDLYLVGHIVRTPVLDHHDPAMTELEIMEQNRAGIEWADRIHMLYDGRSMGTWGDFCMAFALRKPVDIIYYNPKTIKGVMESYAEETKGA